MNKIIPLSIPNFEGNEKKYVNEALDAGWVSTGGSFIDKFEKNLSIYLNVPKINCVQSGTSALHLSLVECGVSYCDAVIVPTITFIAAVNPVKYVGAEPIFIDCDDTLCIDPNKLQMFIDEECYFLQNKRTLIHKTSAKVIKAIIVVHVFGNMADMEAIMHIADKYNIRVIEDATEALGTKYTSGKYSGKYAGTIGHFGAFSFNGNKIITTGGGGAVLSNNKNSTEHIKFLSTQAKTDPHYYIHDEVGYNYRMTNLQAALGVAQLEKIEEFINRKNRFYNIYKSEFKNFDYCEVLDFRDNTRSNKWFLSLNIIIEKLNCGIKDLIEELKMKGVESRPIWGLIHLQKPYLNSYAYNMECCLNYYKRIINIPSSTQLSNDDIILAAEIIKKVIMGHSIK